MFWGGTLVYLLSPTAIWEMSEVAGTLRDYMFDKPVSQLNIVMSTYVAGRIGF